MQGGLDIHIRCIGGLLKLGDNSLDLVGVVEQGVNLGAALKVGHSAAILAELQVALLFASEPAYAAWLSWYFLGEVLDMEGWIGSALILLAVVIGAFGG